MYCAAFWHNKVKRNNIFIFYICMQIFCVMSRPITFLVSRFFVFHDVLFVRFIGDCWESCVTLSSSTIANSTACMYNFMSKNTYLLTCLFLSQCAFVCLF